MDNNPQMDDQTNRLDTTEGSNRANGQDQTEAQSSNNNASPFPTADELLATLHKRQQAAGRAGGLSRSFAKREATKRNIAKARQSRWPGREQANRARAEGNQPNSSQGERETEEPNNS